MGDRAGKDKKYNSPPRRVVDPVRGRYVGRRIEFPAATLAIIQAEGAAARARGEDYLIPLRFMPESYLKPNLNYNRGPVNLQKERRHRPSYMMANRAAAREAAAAGLEEEEEENAVFGLAAAPAVAVAAPAVAAPAVAAPAVAVAGEAVLLAAMAPEGAAQGQAQGFAVAAAPENNNNNNNNNNYNNLPQAKRSRPSRKNRKGRKNRKSRKSRH